MFNHYKRVGSFYVVGFYEFFVHLDDSSLSSNVFCNQFMSCLSFAPLLEQKNIILRKGSF